MAKLVDARGEEAAVGKSRGYWLDDEDFVSTLEGVNWRQLGSIGFPRDWPNVYSSCKVLKSLIGKKGKVPGKKVGVVATPTAEEAAGVKGLTFYPLQSFSNAERVEQATGMSTIFGWAVYEHLDKETSTAFVAERFWWNSMPDGTWVDFTPRPDAWPELLLSEAATGAMKSKSKLTATSLEIATHLLQERFNVVAPAPAPVVVAPSASASKPRWEGKEKGQNVSVPQAQSLPANTKSGGGPSKLPASLHGLVAKVQAADVEAMKELEEKAKDDEEVGAQIVEAVAAPLVRMLSDKSVRQKALSLLLVITDAGVGQKNSGVQNTIVDANAVNPLTKLLSDRDSELQEHAAAVLGNLCHESPINQEKIARAGVFKPLVDMLQGEVGPAQEAAYAIWNLAVGHAENSTRVVSCGAVPRLTDLLKSTSDIAQENAAGALMHVTMSEEARARIVQAGAIPQLCELLSTTHEREVSSQAAGALLNLASDCPEYANMIVKEDALPSLINLVKDGADLACEYAAGALMNLIRGDIAVAEAAAKAGAIPALAGLLGKPTGHSEALGALANLASGSVERQIAIYKAQVTRKSVGLLSDADVDVRRSAAALIMNLAPHPKIKERIVEAGALKPLAAILKDSDDAVKERAAGALANLFNDHSANVHAGFEQAPEMIPALVGMIQWSGLTEDAKRQAAHALAMLAAEDGPCDAVWSAGAGKPILALLDDMVAEAALGVMNLSWRWPEVKHELAQGGALDSLTRMLKTGDLMAKEYAAGALMNVTAGSKENAEKVVAAVPALVELLKPEGGLQAAEWSAGALANIVRAGADAQKTAAEQGAATLLAGLLPKVSPNGKTLVVLALSCLSDGQAAIVQRALSGQKEKQKLREFRDSGSEELQDYTKALVEMIGGGFTL